jgi:hypothetical protein
MPVAQILLSKDLVSSRSNFVMVVTVMIPPLSAAHDSQGL